MKSASELVYKITVSSARGSSILSIFLRAIGQEHEFLTINGILLHQKIGSVHFTISPFVAPKRLTPLLNQLPEQMSGEEEVDTWAPRESSAPLLKAMLDFDRAAKDFYQQHASSIDNIYDVLAHEKEYRYMTTRQITAHILGESDLSKIKPSELLAVHRALLRSPVGFNISDRYHRFTHNFEIVPKKTVEIFKKALVWLRDLQEASMDQVYSQSPRALPFRIKNNPIGAFLMKARTLIAASRSQRAVTEASRVGPDSGTFKRLQETGKAMSMELQAEFNPDEECLVKFLRFWALEHNVPGPYSATLDALGSRLVRATGCYDDFDFEITRATGFMFLQEIGAILPWANRSGFVHRQRIRDYFPGLEVDRLWKKAAASADAWGIEMPIDLMRDLRVDWGSLEVFSIDPIQSNVIDDGFSVEDVPGEPGVYWLHVHVANPTAYIQPDSPIARYAEEVGTTVHLPERVYHMIHHEIAKTYFSIQPDKPVLTFSAKLDLDGNLHGTKISAGIVHNCIQIDLDSLREALYPGNTENTSIMEHFVGRFPNTSKRVPTPQHISQDHLNKLRLVQMLVSARAFKRPHWDLLRYHDLSATVLIDFPPGLHTEFRHRESPIISTKTFGDPQIRVRSIRFDPQVSMHEVGGFDKIVDDAMTLACEVAALWCKERNLPNIYRGTIRNSEVISPEQFRERIIKPAVERTGKPPFLIMREYSLRATRRLLSTHPIKHEGLGLEAYLRVTSPLRRYGELVAHWQIEAAMRYEHETGKALIGCENPDPFLPFSREKIEAMFSRIGENESVITYASSAARLSWIMMFFFRAHHFGQGEMLPTPKVFIRRKAGLRSSYGTLEMVNIDVKVTETEVSKAKDGLQIGDWWECKIVDVNAYSCKMRLEPLKLVERLGKDLCLDLMKRIEVKPHLD